MDKLNRQNETDDGSKKISDETQPNRRAPAYTRFEAKRAADQVIHQITPEDVIKAEVPPAPARGVVDPAPRAPLGDDDITVPLVHVPVRVLH